MSTPTLWDLRRIVGVQTQIAKTEFEELKWRTIAILLERFQDHVDSVSDEKQERRFVEDLDPQGKSYGKFVIEACLLDCCVLPFPVSM